MGSGGRRRERRRRNLTVLVMLFVAGAVAFLLADISRRTIPESARRPIVTRRVESAPEEGIRVINVGPARLTLDTGTQISVPSGEASGRIQIELKRGRVSAYVRPLRPGEYFAVRTFNATAAVRGTTFVVTLIGGYRTEVEVIEGKVSVEGSGGVPFYVSAGQAVSASGLEEPELIRDTGGRSVRDRWLDDLPITPTPTSRTPAPSLDLAPTNAGAASPVSSLSGSGTWTGSQGFSGSVSIRIDPGAGRFTGQFNGTGAGGASISGSTQGSYTGDNQAGQMNGEVVFQTRLPTGNGPEVRGRVDASLANGTVTGRMASPVVDGTFEVQLR